MLLNLLICHRRNAARGKVLFFTRAEMAKWCGFAEADAGYAVADNAGRRVGRIVKLITEGAEKCDYPLLRRLSRGHTGRASTYELIPEAWGDVLDGAA